MVRAWFWVTFLVVYHCVNQGSPLTVESYPLLVVYSPNDNWGVGGASYTVGL